MLAPSESRAAAICFFERWKGTEEANAAQPQSNNDYEIKAVHLLLLFATNYSQGISFASLPFLIEHIIATFPSKAVDSNPKVGI